MGRYKFFNWKIHVFIFFCNLQNESISIRSLTKKSSYWSYCIKTMKKSSFIKHIFRLEFGMFVNSSTAFINIVNFFFIKILFFFETSLIGDSRSIPSPYSDPETMKSQVLEIKINQQSEKETHTSTTRDNTIMCTWNNNRRRTHNKIWCKRHNNYRK